MSAGPQFIAIKRKRGEEAPAALLVERTGKRRITEASFHYVLKDSGEVDTAPKVDKEHEAPTTTPSLFNTEHVQKRANGNNGHQRGKLSRNISGNGVSQSTLGKERRTFHLKRVGTPEPKIGKRKGKSGKERGIATFSEKRVKRDMTRTDSKAVAEFAGRQRSASVLSTQEASAEPLDRPLKRPGKGSAVKTNGSAPSSSGTENNSQVQAVANSLHQFAVNEASREASASTRTKPKVTAMPKLSAQRSRAIHQQRVAQSSALSRSPQNDDTSMDEEGDYVYDTYVLASTSGAAQIDAQDDLGNVGYLIITEEDQAHWETYMDDDLSEEEPSDEDDENAEDWYGADYPDDEVASDDEFDRNAYGYRAGGSDDEEYDEHTFSEDEYERQLNPWLKRTPQQFAKYFDGAAKGDEDD
ncbi:Putative RNA polymerase II nuclear localization protein Iwr1 [Septoria linicola]|uniref:RNA polymerase II nuclear localization protein Iwr1 n=1 Tax=Septoria linicola TaxID=215465 RepID=A0A9Q9EIS3_9PEZI|nr:putative RNA polymerase II nuclear localization protein Iwr1 [Septoria linicola]USW52320.1 Putative RNA polymerase II nuclear localization protein Iwr1 [Septoria linicola]